MSATNLTDIVKSLINSTVNNYVSGPVETWETRLQANWQLLFSSSLGFVLSILIMFISIFSKHITGDYKWFVLNQALANFFFAVGSIAYTLVVSIWYSQKGFNLLYDSDDPPLWVYIFHEARSLLMEKFGTFATIDALFATVFNRWLAIVMSDHYQKFMSARLIVLYCTLCYLLTIPIDQRVLIKLNISTILIYSSSHLIPWLLSTILSVSTFFKLWNHMRTTTTIAVKRRLQASRMVLYSLMFQIAVHIFEKIPYFAYLIHFNLLIIAGKNIGSDLLLVVFTRINAVIFMYTNMYTCIIILITMQPYRRAVLSLISPITKFYLRYLKPNVKPKKPDDRETSKPDVVNVQPAGNVSNP